LLSGRLPADATPHGDSDGDQHQAAMDAHSLAAHVVLASLEVDPNTGLSSVEATARRRRFGLNRLTRREPTTVWSIILVQLKSAVVLLLLLAAAAGFVIDKPVESIAVLIVVVVNTAVGTITELRAVRSMEALSALAASITDVERDDRRDEIDAVELVPGDIVGVEAGDQVPADLRLIEAVDLTVEESALTGESVPVTKSVEVAASESGLGDRHNMLFMGTTVRAGRGRGVVVATGSATEVGKVATLVEGAEAGRAPLQEGLERLGRILSLVVVALAGALALLGLARGLPVADVLEVAIALAVAIVPEGLPAVATLTLTVGMRRMAKDNALVRRLPVVETLGSTTVIASDKTGTLTTNQMTVVDIAAEDRAALWQTAVLCNDSDIATDGDPVGDPTEVALLLGAEADDHDWRAARTEHPRDDEVPFDSQARRMATVHGDVVHVKGAPEVLLDPDRDAAYAEVATRMGDAALRTLAFGRRPRPPGDTATGGTDDAELFTDLEIVGVVGIKDPPRQEAIESIAVAHRAGIRVVMITGDQPHTAQAIAKELGLRSDLVITGREIADADHSTFKEHVRDVDVFARVAPEQKLQIVTALQDAGEIVAVTGDGVNDSPALRKADVGVAMGMAGTDVAREAADIVLTDDDFATIGSAIEEGRRIFANIRRFGQFLFSFHLAVVLVVTSGIALGLASPIAGLMVLWNNLIIDVIPSFALALEPGRGDAMSDPPRPKGESVLGAGTVRRIVIQGSLVAAVGITTYLVALNGLGLSTPQAQTATFIALTSAQLMAVFNARTDRGSGFVGASRNPYLWGALALTLGLEALALFVSPLSRLLGLVPLPGQGWMLALALAPLPLVLTQTIRILRDRSTRSAGFHDGAPQSGDNRPSHRTVRAAPSPKK
jgi:P-type Ca2+ transporter type 2C